MANSNEEKNKKKTNNRSGKSGSHQKQDISALDAAIASAISAPRPPKKALSYKKQKPAGKKKAKAEDKQVNRETKKPTDSKQKPAKPQTKKAAASSGQHILPVGSKSIIEPAEVIQPQDEVIKQQGRERPIRIIPLGGLNEVGKNMTLVEYGEDIVIIDCGMTFPDSEMPGVDIVIPDFTYVEKNAGRIRGVLLTHGHEDHIGAVPYLLKKLDVPVYGTRLTLGLVEGKLKEHNLGKVKLMEVSASQTVRLGALTAEFIRVNHSIPDACAIALRTPAGVILHMGDFKVDYTPIEGGVIDLPRFAELGTQGVLALMSDSTNAERSGFTPSEKKVGESFERLFVKAQGKRIIIATFSSNVHRVQQIIDCAARHNRKVAVFGRSMINVIKLGLELGCLKAPQGVLIDIDKMRSYPDGEIVLITTGSQGEPMSALTRMALNDHRQVSITSNDFIIISARPIPGNEKFVCRIVNELLKLGAEVIYEEMYEVHVSGHACQEEQKLILSLVRPKYFIPVHGEYKHLIRHAATARDMGIPESNILISDIGNIIEIRQSGIKHVGTVPSGKVMVDGLSVGNVGAAVLKDRKHLAQDGVIVVSFTIDKIDRRLLSGPEFASKGFVYEKDGEELLAKARDLAVVVLNTELSTRHDYTAIKNKLKDELCDFFYTRTKRRPTIIPMLLDI